jgi:hypothetical protein
MPPTAQAALAADTEIPIPPPPPSARSQLALVRALIDELDRQLAREDRRWALPLAHQLSEEAEHLAKLLARVNR